VHVALAVIERRGRVLIARRPAGTHLGGYWEFPGGKRNPGEAWTACVRRELDEELGLAGGVRPVRLMSFSHRYPGREIFFVAFHVPMAPGRRLPRAHRCMRWVSVPALGRYRFPPANGRLIQHLINQCVMS